MAARDTTAIGGGGIAGSLSGAATGALIGTVVPGVGNLVGFIVGAIIGGVLGSAVGALALVLGKSVNKKSNAIELTTTQIRDTPVPVVFGRGRLGGNLIDLGNFEVAKDNINGTPGGTVRVVNCVVALCEGSILAVGNVHQDDVPIFTIAGQQRANPDKFMKFIVHLGNSSDTLDSWITDIHHGYSQTNLVPWRNTSYAIAYTIVGPQPRIPNYTFDLYGPPLDIKRLGTTTETNPFDVSTYCGYDGHTERHFYTINSSSGTPAPFGLMTVGRQGEGRLHIQPPTGIGSVSKAWYLGRHDIVVMQDPGAPALFHIGYWGITQSSSDWEHQYPSPDYATPIACHYMDELHGMLHTLHNDGVYRYFLRWNLLTGRVDRLNTDLPVTSYTAMIYSPDFDSYITLRGSTLDMTDSKTGESVGSYVTTGISSVVGLCVSGQMIGLITAIGFYYYSPYTQAQYGPYGSAGSDLGVGSLGVSQSAVQNSWTGHVTLFKPGTGIINFIPSIIEDIQDVNANGSSSAYEPIKSMADFQWLPGAPTIIADGSRSWRSPIYPPVSPSDSFWYTDNVIGWVRDWSYRTHNTYSLHALQGFSSVAAALWGAMVDEPNLNSKRWGAGLRQDYFSLSSFESVHSYCVGVMRVQSQDGTFRLAERYKFDYVLDSETSVSSFVSDQILTCCQGYQTMIDGRLHVGIARQGMFPVWHFSDGQINQDSFVLKFIGRSDGANKVRVDYRNILNEYSSDFAETTDDFDINARGKIQAATLSLRGVGRYSHANLLAKATLDQFSSSKRQAEFRTHFVWSLLVPGDGIEVSERQASISRVAMRITAINEQEKSACQISALEQTPVLDAINGQNESSGIDTGSGGGDSGVSGGSCGVYQESPADDTISWFNSGGAFSAGDYVATYVGGTYSPGAGWNYAVAGFDIVTRTSIGTIVVLVAAPGLSISFPGYSTQDAAETANSGQNVTVTLADVGPIGIRRAVGGTTLANGSSYPTYQLCVVDGGGGGGGGEAMAFMGF